MANEITTGRVHWSYGGHRLLIEHPMPATDDTLLPNSVTFTDFFREERTDALGIGGAILDRRLVVGGLRAGEQTGYSDWETCVNASIPVNWLLDWTPPRLDVDQSVAITLLKQFRLLLAPTEGEAAFSGPRGHHLAPRRQSLAMRLVATDRAQREQLVRELAHAFRAEPLEDGWTHPAEGLVADALSQPRAHEWLHAFCVGPTRIPDAASVLICLGRLDRPGELVWRVKLVREALAADDVELRDAAVQAAEAWGDRELGYILRRHQESVPWLQDYLEHVIEDQDW